ncbi:Dabb family protein [Pseudonocardia cypriaca]|uniref:Stress responsive alpha/beta barrel protein n=1 Tax=Pseudonocardia cypriaca TaxID=882449 RepID=A0A543FT48_9PSEU|nr:Dabb family protein [Pseudonocardia cypriaca]TQM36991.1 stress responsive alpha/beta barrel protein [Pseudonocardia cypriaca]
MISHLAVFRWHDDVDPADVERLCAALATLPAQIPELASYRFGPDLGLRAGNADFGVLAQLPDAAAVATYLDHPAHQDVVRTFTSVMVAQRATVQFVSG